MATKFHDLQIFVRFVQTYLHSWKRVKNIEYENVDSYNWEGFLLFLQAHVKKYTVLISNNHNSKFPYKLSWLWLVQMPFLGHDHFSSSLITTQSLIFVCVKLTPDVVFTGSFIDIVFAQYVKRGGTTKETSAKNTESVHFQHFS